MLALLCGVDEIMSIEDSTVLDLIQPFWADSFSGRQQLQNEEVGG